MIPSKIIDETKEVKDKGSRVKGISLNLKKKIWTWS